MTLCGVSDPINLASIKNTFRYMLVLPNVRFGSLADKLFDSKMCAISQAAWFLRLVPLRR
jgi:hypothetical protein